MEAMSAIAPGNAPRSARFFGRAGELRELRRWITSDAIVTIVGTGGAGKTRLALELAFAAGATFPDGVWFVELARIVDPDLVAAAIAHGVHAPENRGVAPLERATVSLSAGRQLLILDNCEHVSQAAAIASRHLLTDCPGLTIVATSRDPLGVDGERLLPIPPLGLPPRGAVDVATVIDSEAVQLFCDRAARVVPNFRLSTATASPIADICRHLDGLPLALELAAAWVSVLSPAQIVARLENSNALLDRNGSDRDARHRTMRAALDWSYQLLRPPEQAALARLSIFVGGFTIEGAESLLRGPSFDVSALDLVAALLNHSLLLADTTQQDARYRFLEPVRHYAAEQLSARPDEEREARTGHLHHLVDVAEAAEEHVLGGPDLPWLHRLDDELSNVRVALSWGFDNDFDGAARLTAALIWFCYIRSLYEEGRLWARRAMLAEGRVGARAAHMLGTLVAQAGETQAGDRYLAEARDLMQRGGWIADLVMVIFDQGTLAYHRGDLPAMRTHGDEAARLARELGDETRIMQTLWTPATLAEIEGDHVKACELWREAVVIARRRKASWSGWLFNTSLAFSLVNMGDQVAALHVLGECLDSSADFGSSPIINAYIAENVGIVAVQRGDPAGGLRLMAGARAVFDRWRYRETPDEARRRARWLNTARESVSQAEAEAAWKSGLRLTIDETIAEAIRATAAPIDVLGEAAFQRPPDSGAPQTRRSGIMTSEPSRPNTFVREGEFWSLTYAGVVARLKDSKGLQDIARLLTTPGREVAAVDLATGLHRGARRRSMATSTLALSVEGDAGEALDAEARLQYRTRVVDLEDEIADAGADNDPERASRARQEREFLLAQLGAAVGLGGRTRRVLDPAERARKAVTARIRDCITHIEAAHPELGRHLRRSVRTGSFCVYDPPDLTNWQL